MNKLKTLSLLVIFSLVGATAAQAGILELRGGVGINSANPDSFEDEVNSINNSGIEAQDFDVYNADIFINLPGIPLGFGFRQEWMDLDEDSNGVELDLEVTNPQLLVDLRIIDSNFYVGPIIGVGHPSASINYNDGTFSIDDDLDGDDLSYSAGLEAGVIMGIFLIGAEAGYQNVELESTDDQRLRTNIDLSGFYGKAMVGLTFF